MSAAGAGAGPFVPENANNGRRARRNPAMSAAAGAGAGPFVPENANNGRGAGRNVARMGPFVPENARRANNRTRRNVRPPMGIYVPENAGANARPAARALPTTPRYGQLDLRAIQYYSVDNSKTHNLNEIIQLEGVPRYIVAYIVKRGWRNQTGSGYGISTEGDNSILILIDNYGQRHYLDTQMHLGLSFKSGVKRLAFDNERYPVPLPDVLIDQIKLIADMETDSASIRGLRQIPNWDPVANINTLRAAL